jgi:hypothetical protein
MSMSMIERTSNSMRTCGVISLNRPGPERKSAWKSPYTVSPNTFRLRSFASSEYPSYEDAGLTDWDRVL